MGQHLANIKEPIAIVGQSVLFPDSLDSTSFWKHILQGHDLISDVPATHWLTEDYYDPDPSAPDKTYGKRGGFVPHVDFDSLGWGVPPSIIEATDSTQLLALMVAKRCLEDFAGTQIEDLDRSNISVILGVTSAQKLLGHMTSRLQRPIWENAMRQEGLGEDEVQKVADRIADHYVPWQESTFPGLLGNVVAGRIANRLDLGGTNCVTDAACASAFSAISMAINELYLGDSKVVLAGGADTMSDILMHMCFSKTPALSKTGDVRPFSDQADGTLLGEGFAMFAFKRLTDAEADGDQIYGVLKGLGASSDGRAKSVYAPLAEGQAQAYRRAYANGGVDAKTIELVEAHGTGTKAGDAAEFSGLKQVFTEANAGIQQVALGSVKSQIGHTKATAGAAGFFKALMALRSQTLPPTIKVTQPNPNLEIESSPLYINTESRPWVRDHSHPRRAGVSAFGFGGSNFHIVLEEYKGTQAAPRLRSVAHEICCFSAASAADLRQVLLAVLERDERVSFARLAWESQQSFNASHALRLSMVCESRTDLIQKLQAAVTKGFEAAYTLPTGVFLAIGAIELGEIGFLFPGQGAQAVNMGSQVAQAFSQSMDVWDFSAELDRVNAREPLHQVVFPVPAFSESARQAQQVHLTQTQWAQPAIGVTSLALLNLLKDLKLEASRCAGHSYGELTALYYAGVYSEQYFIETSRKRGELMNAAAKLPGAMSAVKGSAKKLQPLLDEWNAAHGIDVVIANHNSPKQSVLSGPVPDIEKVEGLLADAGMFAQRLGVATAFHSKVVAGSVAPFEQYLRSVPFKPATKTVYANLTAKPYDAKVVETLSQQIASPVRFVELIEQMYADGVRTFVEVGPGQILGKLTKSILKKKDAHIISLDRPKKSDLFGLLVGLAELLSLGVEMDLNALWKGYGEPQNFDDQPKPRMTISINGANYNKPYPPKEGAAGRAKPNPPRTQTSSLTSSSQAELPTPAPAIQSVAATSSQGASMSNSMNPEWLKAFQQAQQQTAAAHAAYQQAMSNAHIAYLQAAQASLTGLAALAGGQTPVAQAPIQFQSTPAAIPQPVVMSPPVAPLPMPASSPVVQPPVQVAPMVSVQPTPVTPTPVQPSAPVSSPTVTAPATSETVNVLDLLLDVVAEKTGYPAETLDLSLSLEGDLGIDSIKRVEILSAVRERAPELPEVEGSQMAQLQTLGEIVEFLGGASANSTNSVNAPEPAPVSAPSAVDVTSLLLDVVAEKTGYPAETLDLSLSLEGDLGIDSIKRVEILSAVRERAPELPEVEGSQMAQLQTLGEIIGFLQGDTRDFSQAEVSVTDASANLSSVIEAEATVVLDTDRSEEDETTEAISAQIEQRTVWASTTPLRVTRWTVQPMPTVATGLTHPALSTCKIAIIGDEELAGLLALQLQKQGVNGHVLEQGTEIAADVQGIVDLSGLQPESHDPYVAAQHCFERAQQLVQRHDKQPKVLISVSQFGGDFGQRALEYTDCLAGGAAGVVRTAQQEWPDAHCKNIDITPELPKNQQARILADEILQGGLDLDVGLSIQDGQVKRSTLQMIEQAPTGQLCQFDPDDVLVVSGGGRGVTADCLIHLVHHYFDHDMVIPRIVLLGRTPLDADAFEGVEQESDILKAILTEAKAAGKLMKPAAAKRAAQKVLSARDVRRTIQMLKNFGAVVRYLSVDVSDTEAVVDAFQQLGWGPVTGFIHGAGVLADKAIKDKSTEDFAWVFDVKVQGMEALFNLLDQENPKLAVFFSSVAARTGNAGQSDYAAANEVLNRVAHYTKQRFPTMCVRSIGWGPWEGGMVSPELQRHFASRGVGLIPIRDGAEAFVRELTDESNVEVVIGADAGLDSANELSAVQWNLTPAVQELLKGHTFNGEVLVPMVIVLSVFRAVALQVGLGARLTKINVFNPVHVQSDMIIQHLLMSNQLKLMTAQGKPLYGAHLAASVSDEVRVDVVDEWDKVMHQDGIYDGVVLFHTADFQVMRGVQLSSLAAHATIQVSGAFADVLALDAALQLALHWMAFNTGLRSLPMSMDAIQWYGDRPVTQIRLQGYAIDNKVGRCDLLLLDADDQLVVLMQGVSVVGLTETPA